MKIGRRILPALAAAILLTGCQEPLMTDAESEEAEKIVHFMDGWNENVAQWETEWGPFDGNLDLEEDEWLALDGEDFLGMPGVFLVRDKNTIKYIKDYPLVDDEIISISAPQIVKGTGTNEYMLGVRNLLDESWILEAAFDNIDTDEDIHYSVKKDDSSFESQTFGFKYNYCLYDKDWNLLLSEDWDTSNVYTVQDKGTTYVWVQDWGALHREETSLKTYIYDLNKNLVNTLEAPVYHKDRYHEWHATGDIMETEQDGYGKRLYNADGTLYFDNTMLPEEITATVAGTSTKPVIISKVMENAALIVLECDGRQFLYDREEQKLLSGPDDYLEWNSFPGYSSTVVSAFPQAVSVIGPDGSWELFTSDRSSPETQNGTPYLYFTQGILEDDRQYYYRIDENALIIGDGAGTEYTYPGSFSGETEVMAYGSHIARVRDPQSPDGLEHVYGAGQLLMSGSDISENHFNQFLKIENSETGETITVDESGNYYKTDSADDRVLSLDQRFAIVRHSKSSISILDHSGKTVLQMPYKYQYQYTPKD